MKIDVENPQAVLEDILTKINEGVYVKVTHCKDCKRNPRLPNNWGTHRCPLERHGDVFSSYPNDCDYCSYGEPKEKTDETH